MILTGVHTDRYRDEGLPMTGQYRFPVSPHPALPRTESFRPTWPENRPKLGQFRRRQPDMGLGYDASGMCRTGMGPVWAVLGVASVREGRSGCRP